MRTLLNDLTSSLPVFVTRQELERLTGGLLNARTMANLDCAGKGPSQRIRYGRKIAYERNVIIEWLTTRLEVKSA